MENSILIADIEKQLGQFLSKLFYVEWTREKGATSVLPAARAPLKIARKRFPFPLPFEVGQGVIRCRLLGCFFALLPWKGARF